MTLRFRNRLNLIISSIAFICLLVNSLLLVYSIWNGTFMENDYLGLLNEGRILTKNIPLCVIISLLFKDLYVGVITIVIYRSFVKTQATDIIFFTLFLVSLLVDSARIYIPLLNLSHTYSQLYIFCGNAGVFARLLGPIALLFTVIMGFTEQWQNLEKNILILLIVSFFIAEFLPLNTAVTNDNFTVDHNYRKILTAYAAITAIVTLILQFINNKNRFFSQMTTVGLGLLFLGNAFIYYGTNILKLSIGIILLTTGTIIFIQRLHNQYLWLD